jgi:hypothetical protein
MDGNEHAILSECNDCALRFVEEIDIALTTYYIVRKMAIKVTDEDEIQYYNGVCQGIQECINLIKSTKEKMKEVII